VARGQLDQLGTPAVEEGVATDEEGVGPFTHKGSESGIDLADGAGFEDLDLQPDGASCCFGFPYRRLAILRIGRVDQNGDTTGCGQMQLALNAFLN
jgi:hypothetical protein